MRLERSCKKPYYQSWIWYIFRSGAAGFLASIFHWKCMQRTLEKITFFFSYPHQTLPIKCTPAPVCVSQAVAGPWSCWTPGRMNSSTLNFHLWEDLCGSVPIAISLPSSPGPWKLLPGLLPCTLREIFFFNLYISITRPPFQKAGCFEIMKSFHRSCCFLFLWIPLLTESYRFPEGNCLDFFIASICSHQSHWQTFCLFFRDTKTKPNAIRQRSAHLLNHEQGLGSPVK